MKQAQARTATPKGRASVSPASEAGGSSSELPMHRIIYEELFREIQNGTYRPGDRLPAEAMLCERFTTSRITVAKAIHRLQSDGLVRRVAGSGTYVEKPLQAPAFQFGLLIPELGMTEIFEPMCRGMMRSPLSKSHSLIWGHSASTGTDRAEAAQQLCRQFISQKVAGVFFAPIEFTGSKDQTNREIVMALEKAGIPIVLLDRCFETYPDRSSYDLVGIDNHRAGYVMTRHLIGVGATRIVFAARPDSAPTVDARIAGYREALLAYGKAPGKDTVYRGDCSSVGFVRKMLSAATPDAVVCANDVTAASLMRVLGELGVSIPAEMRVVGIDDVSYANFLPVPLTTLHQNCAEMGEVAFSTMMERLRTPSAPVRDVLLPAKLVVRESCGIRLARRV